MPIRKQTGPPLQAPLPTPTGKWRGANPGGAGAPGRWRKGGGGKPTSKPPAGKPKPGGPGGGGGDVGFTRPGGPRPIWAGTPLPSPGVPGGPIFGPPVGGPAMPGAGPGVGPGAGLPGATPAPNSFNNPFAMFLAAVPGMRVNAQRQIGDAMAGAGFTGNRWGTSAMNQAGQIGAENAMMENALLQKTLSDYANRTEDRALQATGMGMGLGGMLDKMAQDRVQIPFGVGAWEQGRQDELAQFPYMDFEKNKLGWLPLLAQMAASQKAGSPGQIYTTQEPGKPGAVDWLSLLGGLFG